MPNVDDVQDGRTILISPLMDLTTYTSPYLNFDFWFYNYYGPNLVDDTLRVFVSNGTTSVEVFKVGNTGNIQTWKYKSVLLSDFIPITNTMRVTFQTSDTVPNGNITEAAIDRFTVENQISASLETNENKNLELYPNPVENMLTISSDELGEISIFDIRGKLIKQINKESQIELINVSDLENGLYFLISETKSISFIKR
jgi:hypothetical protein